MFSWLAKRALTHNLDRLNARDCQPALKPWRQRFAYTGLKIFADEVVAQGPPWKTTHCLRGHVYLKSPEGTAVYENRYGIWVLIAWGLLREYEVYEDTEKTEALDDHLGAGTAHHTPSVAAS